MNRKKYIKIVHFLLTNKCNSRCVNCSYWKNKDQHALNKKDVLDIIKNLNKNGLDTVIFSGGEPLLENKIFLICQEIRKNFPLIKLRLITNGLLLNAYADKISRYFDVVVVSLDTNNRETYKKIRGVDGFNLIIKGIKRLRYLNKKLEIRARCVIQKENYRSIKSLIDYVNRLGVDKISFLPIDIHSIDSFGRVGQKIDGKKAILNSNELKHFKSIIKSVDVGIKILVNKGHDLNKIYKYYSALSKGENLPPIKCNTPNFSLVIDNNLNVYPCYFRKKFDNLKQTGGILKIFNNKEFIKIRKNNWKNELCCRMCVSPEFYTRCIK